MSQIYLKKNTKKYVYLYICISSLNHEFLKIDILKTLKSIVPIALINNYLLTIAHISLNLI